MPHLHLHRSSARSLRLCRRAGSLKCPARVVQKVTPDSDQRTFTIRVRDQVGETELKAVLSIMVEMKP
jgi:hypothetical protein